MEATPSQPGYADPSTNAPGSYKGSSFFLTIYDSTGSEAHMTFETPITVKVSGNFESGDDLYLYDTVASQWTSASETCTGSNKFSSVTNGVLTVNICHLTQFAVFQPDTLPVSTTSGAAVGKASSGKSSKTTTIIIAVVVPVGVVLLLVIAAIVYRASKNSERKRIYDVELTVKKPIISTTSETSNSRASLTAGTKKLDSDDETSESESEVEERAQPKNAEESESESESQESESEEESSDSSATDSSSKSE